MKFFSARVVQAALFGAVALGLAACDGFNITFNDGESKIKGSGVAASETRTVANFDAIDAKGVGKLKLRIGDTESLKVFADDNVLPLIKTEVKDGVLTLSTHGAALSKTDIVFEVTARHIKRMENSGTVSIDASGFDGGELSVETSGVGSIKLNGRVDSFQAELSGVGSLEADALVADRVATTLSGVGSAHVRADKSLRANVSGVGSLSWTGAATEVSTNVSGIGRVSKG
ncbi:MAG: DUF2807 domain-containing protein [Casimicrobium sp.]